ncbi:MAG: efflux RND transporter periplasmic adaptor subunit [Gemmatimonadaceae bacterium]|nr:efflux RND transporter periplasmic adaptor subunit [Gemmatimonadaceae bacterium]MCW5827601.1 efflux RND transporter periplasmic adaptor subunit [Gemmatimonadaceae bacterium]
MMNETGTRIGWRGIALGTLVLAVAGGVAWWATRDSSAPEAAAGHAHGASSAGGTSTPVMLDSAQATRIGVTYARAEQGALQLAVRSVGQVTYDETRVRTVSLKFDGWVERLFVDFTGRDVRAGEPLLTTYSPMLASAEDELVLAGRLVRDVQNADSSTRAGAERLLVGARTRLRNWDLPGEEIARVEASGESRRTLEIRAPYDGVVVEKLVFEGQRVMAGDPLLRIADLRRVWVDAEIFERDLALVRLGQRVTVELDAFPGRPRSGPIVFLQPVVDPQTRTLRVRVELDNSDRQLRPGMYATIRLRATASAAAVLVPRSAVLSTGRRNIVFVRLDDGMLEPREVVLGLASDDRIEIRSGLAVGEWVVSSATFLVDAESNLGSALGGMAEMPGMAPPPKVAPPPTAPPTTHDH